MNFQAKTIRVTPHFPRGLQFNFNRTIPGNRLLQAQSFLKEQTWVAMRLWRVL